MTSLEDRALAFARAAHGEQKRKYTDNPYIEHPIRVAQLVKEAGGTEEMIAAAYLHDVVEDVPTDTVLSMVDEKFARSFVVLSIESRINAGRPIKLLALGHEFGTDVAMLVDMVTDVSLPADGNRKVRKQKDLEHLAQASPEGKTIKLADLIDNSRDIVKNDPDFAKVYMREKAALLPHLAEGSEKLYREAWKIVYGYSRDLGKGGSQC